LPTAGFSAFEYAAPMKARGSLLLLVCALALPASASGAPVDAPELKLGTIELEGSNGYEVEVLTLREGRHAPVAIVSAERGRLAATYEVRASLGAGIHAIFGSLGQLDVSFDRQSKSVETLEPGCRWIIEAGVFRGSFQFAGEGGYLSVQAVDPVGSVLRLPDGFCGFEEDRPARSAIPGLDQTVLAARAASERGTVSFEASRWHLDGEISFLASLRERVGEMRIERTARAGGGKRSFLTSKASRASVRPPGPFRGSARFRDPAKRPATWTGSLSVSFPGAPDVALAGAGFVAKLCPRVSILSSCLRGRPRPSPYGSGSHSQPLALARLSSLR
jgi:hypothetical protein